MRMEKDSQISPGTESLIRANFARYHYYHDIKSLLSNAHILTNFDTSLNANLSAYKVFSNELSHLSEKIRLARSGEIYVMIWERKEIEAGIIKLETDLQTLEIEMARKAIKMAESKKLLDREFTHLLLKKLPLVLSGTVGVEAEDEEPMDEEEDIQV